MVRSLVALLLRRVLASLVWNDKHAKDLEIVVLATSFRSPPTSRPPSVWVE